MKNIHTYRQLITATLTVTALLISLFTFPSLQTMDTGLTLGVAFLLLGDVLLENRELKRN